MAKVNKVFIYIIAYSAGSCNAPYSEYGNQCVQFAADAGTQSHYNSKLHCRVNGGEIAKLGTADEYKTGTLKSYNFMYLLIKEYYVATNSPIKEHISLMQIIII